jgi:hypothetical protein
LQGERGYAPEVLLDCEPSVLFDFAVED